jgi:hypothetical protein
VDNEHEYTCLNTPVWQHSHRHGKTFMYKVKMYQRHEYVCVSLQELEHLRSNEKRYESESADWLHTHSSLCESHAHVKAHRAHVYMHVLIAHYL